MPRPMKKTLLNYSQGAQFRGAKSIFFFLLGLGLLIFFIAFLVRGYYFEAGLCFSLVPFCLVMAADLRGIEVELEKNLLREYRIRPWGKRGRWVDFSGYTSLKLDLATYSIFYEDLAEGTEKGYSVEQHRHYTVELMHSSPEKTIVLRELADYKEAKRFLNRAGQELNLNVQDRFKERLQASLRKRGRRKLG